MSLARLDLSVISKSIKALWKLTKFICLWSLSLNRYSWKIKPLNLSKWYSSSFPKDIILFLLRSLRLAYRAFRLVFAPDVFYRHLFLIGTLQLIYWLSLTLNDKLFKDRRLFFIKTKNKEIAELKRKLSNAATYKEWSDTALKIDRLEGKEAWKTSDKSDCYDAKKLRELIALYNGYIDSGDIDGLIFHLRSDLMRNNYGIGSPVLFDYTLEGTKDIVETYIKTISKAVKFVCTSAQAAADSGIENRLQASEIIIACLNETRHAYGRSALCLSGGASRGVYHLGVVKALHEANVLPRVISGASAGSLIAAKLAVTKDEEMSNLWDGSMSLKFFSDVDCTIDENDNKTILTKIMQKILPMLPINIREPLLYARKSYLRNAETGAFLDVGTLIECARTNLGDYTFQEAYDRTGRIVNITISSTTHTGEKPRILNYLTSPNVILWSAAVASCAIPGVFDPIELLAKDKNGEIVSLYQDAKWSDGSFEADLPMQRLAELFNVNQFIVSQVNPHATLVSGQLEGKGFLQNLLNFLKNSIKNYVNSIDQLGFSSYLYFSPLGWGLVPLITQKYEGDRTIVPPMSTKDLFRLLVNPTLESFFEYIRDGEKCTWPHYTWLRNSLMIEIALDDSIKQLRQTLRNAKIKGSESSNSIARIQSFLPTRSRLNLSDMDVGAPGLPSSSNPLSPNLSGREKKVVKNSPKKSKKEGK